MKNFTFFFVACFLAIFNLSAQEATNSVSFSGEAPEYAIVGGKAILSVDINIGDAQPANLMMGIIKLDADNNPDIQPVAMKIIPLSDVAPYSKQVTDTLSVPADLALSSALTNGDKYAYFCTILTAAFSPIDQDYSVVTVVDNSVGNQVGFLPAPEGAAAPGNDELISVGLTIADAQPANLIIGIIILDADGNPGLQPQIMKITPLTVEAPYCIQVTDTVSIPADFALSSSLTNGDKYAYFCTILTAAFSPIDQEYSEVMITATSAHDYFTNSIRLYPNPAKDRIYLTGSQPNEQIGIYNVAGNLVLNTILSSNQIDISGLQTGVYLIKGESFVSKFVKR